MKYRIYSVLIAIVLTVTAFGNVLCVRAAADDIAASIIGDCVIDHTIEVQTSETDGVTYQWYLSQEENGTYEEIKNGTGKTLQIMPWYAGAWIKAEVSKDGVSVFTEPVKELSRKTVLESGISSDAVGSKTIKAEQPVADGYVSVALDYKKAVGSSNGCEFIFVNSANSWGSKITFWNTSLMAETDGMASIATGTDDGSWHTLNFTIDFTADGNPMKVYIDNGVVAWEDSRYGADEFSQLLINITGAGFEYKDLSVSHLIKRSTPPEAQNVNIAGEALPNRTLTAEYDYIDSDNDGGGEGESQIRWFVSESSDDTYSLIPNQNNREFVPTDLFIGTFVKCSVKPVDKNLSEGSEVFSEPIQILSDKDMILDEGFENGDIHNQTMLSISDKAALENDVLVLNNDGQLFCKLNEIVQQRYVIDFDIKKQSGFCTVDIGNGKQLKLDYNNGTIVYDGEATEYPFQNESASHVACEVNLIENTITFTVNYQWFIVDDLTMNGAEPELTVLNSGDAASVGHVVIYTSPKVGSAPQASNVVIVGASAVDSTVTVDYEYFDADGDEDKFSVIKWYLSNDNTNFELLQNGTNLDITEEMAGKYIKASVVPVDARSTVGEEAFSGSIHVSTDVTTAFDEDFSNFIIGSNGWKIESGTGTIERKDGHLYYENTSGESFMVSKTFDVADADSLRYDVTLKCLEKIDNGVLYYNLRSAEGLLTVIRFSGDTLSVYLRNSASTAGMETYDLGKIDFSKAYSFTFQINMLSQTFDLYLDGSLVKSDCYFAEGYNKTLRPPSMVYIDSSAKGAMLSVEHHVMKKMTNSESHTTLNCDDMLYYANNEGVSDTYVSKAGDEVYAKVEIENFEGTDKDVVVTLASYLNGMLTDAVSKTYSIPNSTNYRYYESPRIQSNGNETFKCYVWRTDINNLKLVSSKNTFYEETVTQSWDVDVNHDIDSNLFEITGSCDYSDDVIIGMIAKTEDGEIIGLNTTSPDDNGVFSLQFKPADGVSGNISVKVGLMNMSQVSDDNCSLYHEDTVTCLQQNEINDILDEINASQTGAELEKAIDKNVAGNILLRGDIKQDYERCKAEAIRYLHANIQKENYQSLSKVNRDLSAVIAAITIQNAEDACSEIERYIDLLYLEKDPWYAEIQNYIDVAYLKLTEGNMPDTYEAMADTMRKAQVITLINYSGADRMETLFERYSDVLQLNLTGDYSKVNKIDVGKLMVGKAFDSIKDIQDAFSDAVNKIKSQDGGRTPSSGGGGSGGGSGGNMIANIAVGSVETAEEGGNTEQPAQMFRDVDKGRYSYRAIEKLAEMSVINGYEDGCFYPEQAITREEFSKMVVLTMKYTKGDRAVPFQDVKRDAWYYDYIQILYSNGIIQGISNEYFGVGNNITREDMATIIYRCLMKDGGKIEEQRAGKSFGDSSQISDYARQAIDALYRGNIINGMEGDIFAPKDNTTREQAAVILYNIISEAYV